MKYLLAFFSGVVAVTSFVVASGARTSWLVVLGFIVATLCYGLLRKARRRLVIAHGNFSPPSTRVISVFDFGGIGHEE